MLWRLILVLWAFALLIGVAWYFSTDLFALVQTLWSLDKEQIEKANTLLDLAAKAFAILAGAATGLKLIFTFLSAKKPHETSKDSGHAAIFHDQVTIKGDFVQGNKFTPRKGGDDA